ncbi:MAG: protein translocase subunit SecD, partial [Thermoguttaceae bacterium]|nr:protein translocase subunit SecD [Thermoguttaceae bacterium]
MVIAVLLAMVAISAGTSIALTRRWNMPTHYWRFFWSMFAFLFGVVVLCHSASVDWTNVKKGIDLNGGTILHYKNMTSDVDSGELAEALKKRIDPDGIANVTIRTLGVNKDQIEIIVPDTDEAQVDMLKKRISKIGTLEFRILANNIDNKDCFDAVQDGQDKVFLTSDKTQADAWWVPIAVGSEENFGVNVDKETGVVSGMGSGYHFTRAIANNFDTASNKAFDPKKPVVEVLVVNDMYNVEGKYLADASAGFDNAKPIVQFSFNTQGANRMARLTGDNLPVKDPGQESGRRSRQLGIILDNQIISAPNIQSQIAGNGQITGIDSQEEVNMIVSVLKAGRLPATLSTEPISEMSTGAQLGADTIQRAQYAMLVSILLVMALMVYYYRFSGIVSVISLMLLVLLTFAFMVSFNAAFTLPGLAGFVLTIGMVVDANILIYERIREETEAGNGVAVAVRTGFDKAFSAIVDSNITTALVGMILYTIGTQEIRGFAIILLVGIAISMFSIIYVGRGIFDLAVRSGMLREIRMRRILPKTSIPFMSYAKKTLTIAAVCAVACVLLVIARTNGAAKASSLLDIDFLGGLNVQVLFTEAQEGEDAVREKLQAANEAFTD